MRLALFALGTFVLAASPVAAQDAQTVEVTPYLAIGTAGASPIGVAVTFPITSTLSLETDVAYRRGEGIPAFSTSGSLLYTLSRSGRARPYAACGVGVSQHGSPLFGADGRPIGSQSRLAVTLNTGAGVKMPLTDKLALRTDARYYKSFGREGSEAFRVAQGISFGTRKR